MGREFCVLADAELYRPHSGLSQYMLWIAAIGAVVLAVVGFHLWNLSRKSRERGETASPEDLMAELCKAHELSRNEQTLLMKIARDQQLAQPAALFIDPQPFDRAVDGPDVDAHACRALRVRLFGVFD
jgi:hypothetical protein